MDNIVHLQKLVYTSNLISHLLYCLLYKLANVLLCIEKDIATEAAREVLKIDKSRKSSFTGETIDSEKGQDEKNLPSDPQDEVVEKESYATNVSKFYLKHI